jgi:hypothetical protein
MEKDFKPVKSVYSSNFEVITNIMELYGIEQFDLDCTYSKGSFWKDLSQPKLKSDIYPINDTVINASSENLPFESDSMSSIMYDPPFVVVGKTYRNNKEGSSIIAKRFEGYETFNHLKSNYYNSLKELYRVCKKGGYVIMKCQDTVSGGKNHFSHVMVMNMAMEMGFYPKDLFILLAKMRINSFGSKWTKQEHARKYHSYFWVFEKVKPKVDYNVKLINEQGSEVSQDTLILDQSLSNL